MLRGIASGLLMHVPTRHCVATRNAELRNVKSGIGILKRILYLYWVVYMPLKQRLRSQAGDSKMPAEYRYW